MNQTDILTQGFDIDLILTGDKSTFYCYLSHPKYGVEFIYGFGKDLDSAVNKCWENFISWRTLNHD